MFHKTFVPIAEFDWLPGRKKGQMLEKKKIKDLRHRNRKACEVDIMHTC